MGMPFVDWIHLDDRPMSTTALAQIKDDEGGSATVSVRIRHADGQWCDADVTLDFDALDGGFSLLVHG